VRATSVEPVIAQWTSQPKRASEARDLHPCRARIPARNLQNPWRLPMPGNTLSITLEHATTGRELTDFEGAIHR